MCKYSCFAEGFWGMGRKSETKQCCAVGCRLPILTSFDIGSGGKCQLYTHQCVIYISCCWARFLWAEVSFAVTRLRESLLPHNSSCARIYGRNHCYMLMRHKAGQNLTQRLPLYLRQMGFPCLQPSHLGEERTVSGGRAVRGGTERSRIAFTS